jgi:hypothetical protein
MSPLASRLGLMVVVAAGALALVGCPDDSKTPMGPMTPAGPGYDNLRTLSRDDCAALRDHQIEIAVEAALAPDGGTEKLDAGEKHDLEVQLRLREKSITDAWIRRCTGRMMSASDLRCLREATTPESFNACGNGNGDDAGVATASDATAD